MADCTKPRIVDERNVNGERRVCKTMGVTNIDGGKVVIREKCHGAFK